MSDQGSPAAEWAVAWMGAGLVAAALGFVAWEGVTEAGTLPAFQTIVEGIESGPGGHSVRFTVHNTGRATAAHVTVRATLRRNGQVVDSIEATFDYVPAESRRSGGFIFQTDPRRGELQIDAVAWTHP